MSAYQRVSASQRPKLLCALAIVLAPVVFFYTALFHFAVNIPNYDDYDAGLDYLNHQIQFHGVRANLLYLLTAQHNEYKIVLGHAAIWLQYGIFHHIDFRLLDPAGNIFVLLIAVVLWKMFLPQQEDFLRRLTLFIPVAWLLFQLDYVETLNWPLPALQNVAVVFFVLGSIYLLVKPEWPSFFGAVAMLGLAVAASGNGFMLVPVGAVVLAASRRYAQLLFWLIATVVFGAIYAYQYHPVFQQPEIHRSVSTVLLKPVFVIAFLGSTLQRPAAAILLGLALCICFVVLGRQGYLRRNPMIACTLGFVLLTSIGVAGIRSNFGVGMSVSSRYRMYSDLLMILVWFAIAEERLQYAAGPLLRNRLFVVSVSTAIVLSLGLDAWGLRFLSKRERSLITGMRWIEHDGPSGPADLHPPVDSWDRPSAEYRTILQRSIELGTYRPAAY